MEEQVKWYIREYRCRNGICENTKFPVFAPGTVREGSRRHTRAVDRAEKQAVEAARELARLLNNNFATGRDCYLTLDYSGTGIDRLIMRAGTDDADELYLSAEREAENFAKRLRRACKAAGVEMRYAYVTSDMDGETFAPARIHHHLVINAEAASLAEKCWTAGGAMAKVLYGDHGDLTVLAEYMIGQVRAVMPGRHRYHPSRTLDRPEPYKTIEARNPEAPLMVPKGCEFVFRSETHAGRAQTLRYYRPPEKRGRNRRGGQSVMGKVSRGGNDK